MGNSDVAALFALRVYDNKVEEYNLPLDLETWSKLTNPLSVSDGFAYGVFKNSNTNEVVISYRGTDAVMGWDGANDAAMYLGIASSQAKQAAAVYVAVLQQYGNADGTNISFTGHSLGGGLASIMAVLFDRPATVFDPAPFRAVAENVFSVQRIKDFLKNQPGAFVPDALKKYVSWDIASRESRVQSYYAVGEFLQPTRSKTNTIYATNEPITFGDQVVDQFTMHSQALLTAGLLSDSFRAATVQVPRSVPFIMSETFYSPETKNLATRNFLIDAIRSEQGDPGRGKLTHLAADLQKLGVNLTGLTAGAQDALVTRAIEWYYWQANGQDFFTAADGALQFSRVAADVLGNAPNKADAYTRAWLDRLQGGSTVSASYEQWNVSTSSAGSTASALDPTKSQAFVGNAGSDKFTGGNLADVMIGGAGDDILDGRGGSDLLIGGTGTDTYIVSGGDLIRDDSAGLGRLQMEAGMLLAGGRADGKQRQWVGPNGETYTLRPGRSPDMGTMVVGNVGAGTAAVIENFDMARAIGDSGYLGIKLDDTPQVALLDRVTRFWNDSKSTLADLAGRQSTMLEGAGKMFTVALSNPAKLGESIGLTLLGLAGKNVKAVNGATTVDADGAVIALTEGQTEVSFALVQDGGLDADALGSLSVTYNGLNQTATSNSWGLALQDAGAVASTMNGDQRAKVIGTETQTNIPPSDSRYGTFAWNETTWNANGTLFNGVAEANFADVIYGTDGNDKINGNGGNDALSGGAGNDVIDGGTGDDLIGGGAGSDTINGGDGNDYISSSGDCTAAERLTMTDKWLPPAGAQAVTSGQTWGIFTSNGSTSWQGMGDTPTTSDGDVIDAGAGDDWVIAGWGDDRVQGGDGNDLLNGLAGDDVLEGGLGDDQIEGDGTVKAGLLNSVSAANHGADFLDGGDGADLLIGGGNSDQLFGGAGNDQLAGDSNGATDSPDYVDLAYHGDDYLDGEDGDDYLEGDGGDDTLYGGAGDDALWGDASATFVARPEHNALMWGDDTLDGGDGKDTLIGGGGNDELCGGAGDDALWGDERALGSQYQGEDYLDGGEGNDFLEGGGKDDTLFGGAGDDNLWGDSDPASLAAADHGNDYLDGGDGDDTLVGNGGGDTLFGGTGNDTLLGDNNADELAPEFQGNDYLDGGDGNDLLFGDGGDDILEGGLGDDQLQGGDGDDQLAGGDGQDLLSGEAGDDTLNGGAGDDQLTGGLGNDVLDGGDGRNTLDGGEGNDILTGGSGSDQLHGGSGDDQLSGGGGDDVYFYRPGDGIDHITDSGGSDRVIFTNISSGQVEIGVGSLKITVAGGGEVHLDDFDPAHPMDGAIEWFQFSDGTFTRQQLIDSHGFRIAGTSDADTLSGTALGDRINGFEGDDVVAAADGNDVIDLGSGNDVADAGDGDDSVTAGDGDDYVLGGAGADSIDGGAGSDWLYGDAGDDRLLGGTGDDLLSGGSGADILSGGDGNDMYEFASGDGQDTIFDEVGANFIQLTAGLGEAQIRLMRSGADLVIASRTSDDRLTVTNWFANAGTDWTLGLADGTTFDRAAIEQRLWSNEPPILADDSISVSEDGIAQVAGNALANDVEPDGGPLRVTNGGDRAGAYGTLALAEDGSFTYTLDNEGMAVQSLAAGQTGTDTFVYIATDDDPLGAASSVATVVVNIQGANDSPFVGADLVFVSEDNTWPASGNVLNNDVDVDLGSSLRTIAPAVMPGRYGSLSLASDGSFSYTVDTGAAQVQSLGRNQRASDQFNYLVSDGLVDVPAQMDVTIRGMDDAPIVAIPLPDQTVSISGSGASYLWQVPAGSFTDIDAGDTLTYTASLPDGMAWPDWLTFDSGTQTFSGTVPSTATGFLDIQVTATEHAPEIPMTVSAPRLEPRVMIADYSVTDTFRLTFVASSGKGNEGVGNGEDPPPPGHDTNQNDGPGTSPGHPGARDSHQDKQAKDDHTAKPKQASGLAADSHAINVPSDSSSAPDAAESWKPAAMSEPKGIAATDISFFWPEPATRIAAPASEQPEGADSFMTQWAEVDERLLAHLAGPNATAPDHADGSDASSGSGLLSSAGVWREDPLSRHSASPSFTAFQGLKEGLRQLAM